MKILSIVIKEIMHNVKDKKVMFLMIIFPILLILILGTALSDNFETSGFSQEVKVIYMHEDKSEVYENFKSFKDDIGKKLNINFIETKNKKQALNDVSNGKYDCLINIKDEKSIEIVNNNIRQFNGNLVKTVMGNFVDRYNLVLEVSKESPELLNKVITKEEPNFVQVESIKGRKSPSSKDYYAVTMFTMIILYSTNSGAFSIFSEKIRKTYERIMISSVRKGEYLFAKIFGVCIVTFFQVGIVYLFSKYAIRTNWGGHSGYILLIAASLIFMSVSVGVGISSGIKNPILMAAAINMTIPIFVFLAGGYVPLNMFSSDILNLAANISPLKWTNEAMFSIIYNNDLSKVAIATTVNIVIGSIFILISLFNTNRKDVI